MVIFGPMWLTLLDHSGLLGLLWLGTLPWLWRGPSRWKVVVAIHLALVAWLGVDGLRGGFGPGPQVQWVGIAALIWVGRAGLSAGDSPSLWSLLPLLLALGQGPGAVLAAVVIAGSGVLEAGRRGRGLVLFAILVLAGAALWDRGSLSLWTGAMRWLHLGQDAASVFVDLGAQVVRGAAWLSLLAWLARSPGRSVGDPIPPPASGYAAAPEAWRKA